MLPFALKITWFVLSLTSIPCAWIVVWALCISVNAYWLMIYPIGVTIIEGVFCLGLIWHMNPFLMPKAFCVAQTVIISFSTYLLTGVCVCATLGTTMCIVRPARFMDLTASGSVLAWRPIYWLPVGIFPVIATIVDLVVILKLDAVKPTDDLHCDASSPEWVRFLGYSGVPLIFALPCFYLSSLSAWHIYKTHVRIQQSMRSNLSGSSGGGVTQSMAQEIRLEAKSEYPPMRTHQSRQSEVSLPSRKFKSNVSFSFSDTMHEPMPTITSPAPTFTTLGRAPSSPSLSARQFHMPLVAPMQPIAVDPITEEMAQTLSMNRALDGGPYESLKSPPKIRVHKQLESYSSDPESPWPNVPPHWTHSNTDFGGSSSDHRSSSKTRLDLAARRRISTMSSKSKQSFAPSLAPAIWRLVAFQFAFFGVILLASVNTIIDVATHRKTPTPFGTQHIALILAGWGPLFVLGHFGVVRDRLTCWR